MPSHIYYRVGRYLDAYAVNKTAVAVDETYLSCCDTDAPMSVYRLGYYPHNIHFMMVSAQMAGDGATAIAAAEKLRNLIPDDVARGIAMIHPIKAAPYFAHAQFTRRMRFWRCPIQAKTFRTHKPCGTMRGRLPPPPRATSPVPKRKRTPSPASPIAPISRRCKQTACPRWMS